MTRDEELLNEIIQRRGYLVLCGGRFRPGDVIDNGVRLGERDVDTETKWYVLSQTDLADAMEQLNLLNHLQPHDAIVCDNPCPQNFYRVLSD